MIRFCFSLFCCLMVIGSVQAKEFKNKGDYVVVLHGIARSSSHMTSLSKYLHHKGFNVLNLDYPSTDHKIAALTTILNKEILRKTD